MTATCPLCHVNPSDIVWEDDQFFVLDVKSVDFPGYVRVIAKRHVKEMSDLTDEESAHLWQLLRRVERAMIDELQIEKVNLAEFGNEVPHLHWHLIPRWKDDPYFPGSAWSPRKREVSAQITQERQERAQAFLKNLRTRLAHT